MNLTTRVCLAAGSVFGLVSLCAALPPVLDQVPANAAIVVTIPNPAQLEKNLQSLTTATQLPIPPLGVQDMLNMAGIMEGVEVDKGMAVIISAPADAKEHFEPGEGNTVFLVPVKSYADLIKNFESKAKEPGGASNAPTPVGGVDELTAPDGNDLFARDLKNGYAIMGETRAAVEGFKPAAKGAPGPRARRSLIRATCYLWSTLTRCARSSARRWPRPRKPPRRGWPRCRSRARRVHRRLISSTARWPNGCRSGSAPTRGCSSAA
jgi:hypothetical protein